MNLLLSYPRSGNTWLRYSVECVTKKPTIGYLGPLSAKFDNNPIGHFVDIGIDKSAKNIMTKRHAVEIIDEPIEKLILVVRDYKEVIVRHRKMSPDVSLLKDSCSSEGSTHNYIQLIDYFDKFEGDKIIIHYEDIITDIKSVLTNLVDFFGESDEYIEDFMNKIEIHKMNSIGIYGPGGSETKGKSLKHHSNKMTSEQKGEWDSFLKLEFPDLFDKYLKRYEE